MADTKIPVTSRRTGEVQHHERAGRSRTRRDGAPAEEQSVHAAGSRADAQHTAKVASSSSSTAPNHPASSTGGKDPSRQNSERGKPKAKIETLEQFIEHAYSRKGRRVPIKQGLERRVGAQARLDPDAVERLLKLSQGDRLLAVPRQLLLSAREITGYPEVRRLLRNFVQTVLLAHPIFQREELLSALRGLEDAPSPLSALELLATSGSLEQASDDGQPLKPAEAAELRANAVYCMAVWLADARGLSPTAVAELLHAALWSKEAKGCDTVNDRLRVLTEIRDRAGTGVACIEFSRQALEREQALAKAERAVGASQERVQALENELQDAHRQVVALEEETVTLRRQLEEQKIHGETTQTHLRDDLEQQRTRLLRRLKEDVALLDEGLLALRRQTPKVHVMDDHAERVLDALRRELKRLEVGE